MANKVQSNCIKVLFNTGNIEAAVKVACLANIENGNGLFLGNVKVDTESAGISPSQFAGGLSALTAKGYYTPSQDPEYRGLYGFWNDAPSEV